MRAVTGNVSYEAEWLDDGGRRNLESRIHPDMCMFCAPLGHIPGSQGPPLLVSFAWGEPHRLEGAFLV